MLVGDSGEAGMGEWSGVVGQADGAEAGQDAKGKIEAADQELCGETHRSGRDAEVGDEPEGAWRECWSDACDEGIEIGLVEAVEKEVGDDEIVRAFGNEGDRVLMESTEAAMGVG